MRVGGRVLLFLLFNAALVACAEYHAAPLPVTDHLDGAVGDLQRRLPNGRVIPADEPLSLTAVAELAVMNNSDLVAARAQHLVSAADLLAAGRPPDPSFTAGFSALLGGPGTMPAIAASFVQEVGALITYKADRAAAKAGLAQVDAGVIWQEWQVSSKAEQLVVNLVTDRELVSSLRADEAVLSGIDQATKRQIAQNVLTLNEGATSMAALASVQSALDAAQLSESRDRGQLDALLGLRPGTDIALAAPAFSPPSPDIERAALATLPERRPDLIALRYGYTQADAKLRAAILGQFLPLSIGAGGGRDTTGVDSAGPQVTFTLPLFNRNRGAIAIAVATRAALAAAYQAALDNAVGGAGALAGDIAILRRQSDTARQQATAAAGIAGSARFAFESGQLNATSFANLQVAAGERQRNAISLAWQLETAELSLAVLLGLGLPPIDHILEPGRR